MARSSGLRVRLGFVLGLVVVSMLSHYAVDAVGVVCEASVSAICIPAKDNASAANASQGTIALHTGFLPPPVITTVTSVTPMPLILATLVRPSLISLSPPLLPPR